MPNSPADPIPSVAGLRSLGTGSQQAAPGTVAPLTTKGDLLGYSTLNARVAVGATNGDALTVDSTAATGLAYAARERLLYVNSADGTTVTNPGALAETDLSLTFVVPAGAMNVVGRAMRINHDSMVAGTAGNTTTTIKVKTGAIELGSMAAGGTPTTSTKWQAEIILVCRSTGATGTLFCTCTKSMIRSSAFPTTLSQPTATVDLTAAFTVKMTVTFTNAGATNAITQKLFMAEILN